MLGAAKNNHDAVNFYARVHEDTKRCTLAARA